MHLMADTRLCGSAHSLLLHILSVSVRGQSWSRWPGRARGHSPAKKDGHLTISRIPADSRKSGSGNDNSRCLLCHEVSEVRSHFMECLEERKCCAMFLHASRHQRMWINTTNAPLFTQRFKSANHFKREKNPMLATTKIRKLYSQQKTGCY